MRQLQCPLWANSRHHPRGHPGSIQRPPEPQQRDAAGDEGEQEQRPQILPDFRHAVILEQDTVHGAQGAGGRTFPSRVS